MLNSFLDKKDIYIKLVSLVFLVICAFIYIYFLKFIEYKVIYLTVGFYFLLRVLLDIGLIIYSIFSDEKVRLIVEKISNRRVKSSVSWINRAQGMFSLGIKLFSLSLFWFLIDKYILEFLISSF